MSIQLIVGLANPGKEYAETRHNAGAWFVDLLATDANTTLRKDPKFHGMHANVVLHDRACQLLVPTTYMNLSGQAVRALMMYHKIPANALLVAHDDIDLPVGTIKIKFDGGDGGHNGLRDIIDNLHTKQFFRLRIGVGHPGNRHDVADYVLEKPSKADSQKIHTALQAAADVVPLLLDGQIQKAMQALHTADI